VTVEDFNAADTDIARAALLQCCGSKQWAQQILANRPFEDFDALLTAAGSVWSTLEQHDWLEAFSAHPKIGQKNLSNWSSQEQNGINTAPDRVLEQLARGNQEYEQRFGWIFLVNATGKTAPEILALLSARLKNEHAEELRVAAAEQAQITKLRLHKLFTV
jgi:2-oxo-4-hydroxy-4-carboxy-5-ureidoimidazoline decarboxylase